MDAARCSPGANLCPVPTQSERQALLFLASVALLGVGWRTVRASVSPEPTTAEREALSSHIGVVDSVRAGRHRKPARASSEGRETTGSIIDVDRATESELESLPRV